MASGGPQGPALWRMGEGEGGPEQVGHGQQLLAVKSATGVAWARCEGCCSETRFGVWEGLGLPGDPCWGAGECPGLANCPCPVQLPVPLAPSGPRGGGKASPPCCWGQELRTPPANL